MSTDRRELALARLIEIAETIDGATVFRNKDEFSGTQLPAILILDSDEASDENTDAPSHKGTAPVMVLMTPEIYLKVGGKAADIGPDINALRVKFVKAALLDNTLAGILTSNGRARYHGCSTALGRGRTMESEMRVHLVLTYPFKPTEL